MLDKLIERSEEKLKVTSLEIIVTGTKDKPYFEIKYKEVGKEYYNIGYNSYDLKNVFGWKEECFEIVKDLAEKHNNGWIPCEDRLPEEYGEYLCCDKYSEYIIGYPVARKSSDDFYVETEHEIMNDCVAWQPLPAQYKPKKEGGIHND